MAAIIPSEHKSALKKLQALQPDQFDALLGALRSAEVRFDRDALIEQVTSKSTGLPAGDTSELVELLFSMEFARVAAEVPLPFFLSGIESALARAELATTNADGTPTIERLKSLLQAPSLSIPTKARTLLLEGKTLCRARVVSDIRPVFDTSESPERPEAAVIVHNLRISYHEGIRPVQDFIVTLDSKDLDTLIGILNRAKAKEKTLESLLDSSAIAYLKID